MTHCVGKVDQSLEKEEPLRSKMGLQDLTSDINLAWTSFLLKFPHRCHGCKYLVYPSQHPRRVRKKWFHKECDIAHDMQTQERLFKKALRL